MHAALVNKQLTPGAKSAVMKRTVSYLFWFKPARSLATTEMVERGKNGIWAGGKRRLSRSFRLRELQEGAGKQRPWMEEKETYLPLSPKPLASIS